MLKTSGKIIFVITVILFGIDHILHVEEKIDLVPEYIPFPVFWIFLSGFAFIAAAISIALNYKARLSAILLAITITFFTITVYLPDINNAMIFSMFIKDICIVGSLLIIASISK
jgi:putative oxidoreductase